MYLPRILIRALLYLPYGLRRLTGTGTFNGKVARFAEQPNSAASPPLKAALWQNHVKQYHESSCSVASIAACLNAVRALRQPSTPLIDQMELLSRVRTANWKERMSDRGDNGRRGLPLELLGRIVKDSFAAYGLEGVAVATVQTSRAPDKAPAMRQELRARLLDFEKGRCLLIAHFDQGSFLPALNIPHISPVGGFDAGSGEVVILDVDPEVPRPYSVSFDVFYRGLSCNYLHVFRPFGYGSGGYVLVNLPEEMQ